MSTSSPALKSSNTTELCLANELAELETEDDPQPMPESRVAPKASSIIITPRNLGKEYAAPIQVIAEKPLFTEVVGALDF